MFLAPVDLYNAVALTVYVNIMRGLYDSRANNAKADCFLTLHQLADHPMVRIHQLFKHTSLFSLVVIVEYNAIR